jgi:hypothetical protein
VAQEQILMQEALLHDLKKRQKAFESQISQTDAKMQLLQAQNEALTDQC